MARRTNYGYEKRQKELKKKKKQEAKRERRLEKKAAEEAGIEIDKGPPIAEVEDLGGEVAPTPDPETESAD